MTNKKFTKVFIGKGKRVEKLPNIVTISLNFDLLEEHVFEYEGKRYLKIEVAPLKEEDNFGRTHTAYISKMEAVKIPKRPKPKPTKPTYVPEPVLQPEGHNESDDLPF